MRLPAFRTLRHRPRLSHPIFWPALRNGTVGLRNPASCDPVRERGDQVFGEHLSATTGLSDDTTAAEDFFPNDDYFPDIDNLFDDMFAPDGNQLGSSFSTPHVGSSSSVPYVSSSSMPFVFLLLLLQIMLECLLLEISLNMLFFILSAGLHN